MSYADSTGNNEQYLYSDDGLRKKRVSGSAITLFTYDETALLLETDASLNLQVRYTNKPETWGGLASQNRSGVSSFYGFDSQQSARILVSIAGAITDSYSYKAFGEELQSGSGTVNPYRYVALALYYRELADLLNTWHRWLKPSVGRWVSRDATGFRGGGWNGYRDRKNNPVTLFDPSGNLPVAFTEDKEEGPEPCSALLREVKPPKLKEIAKCAKECAEKRHNAKELAKCVADCIAKYAGGTIAENTKNYMCCLAYSSRANSAGQPLQPCPGDSLGGKIQKACCGYAFCSCLVNRDPDWIQRIKDVFCPGQVTIECGNEAPSKCGLSSADWSPGDPI